MCVQYEIQHGRLRLPARLPPAFQNRPVLAPAAVESQGLLFRLSYFSISPERPAPTSVFINLTREHDCILYTGTRLCSLNVNGPLWAPRMTYPENCLYHPL